MFLLMALNLGLQCTPCYMQEKLSTFRLMFWVVIVALLFGIAVTWALCIATPLEMELLFPKLMRAFGFLALGFVFYVKKFPEKWTSNYYVHIYG